jgi:hypothetical protein
MFLTTKRLFTKSKRTLYMLSKTFTVLHLTILTISDNLNTKALKVLSKCKFLNINKAITKDYSPLALTSINNNKTATKLQEGAAIYMRCNNLRALYNRIINKTGQWTDNKEHRVHLVVHPFKTVEEALLCLHKDSISKELTKL